MEINVRVRPVKVGDAKDVAVLCIQLGYASSAPQIEKRLGFLMAYPEHGIFVAESRVGKVIGFVHIHGRWLLEEDPSAEIGGIAVLDEYRRQGAGKAVLVEAERWALARELSIVRVRSNTVRVEAHAFYPGCGYRHEKSQHVYLKTL